MHISFHGAAGGVTGSCHLVEVRGRKILVDCGLFQGSREIVEENREPLGFDPREVGHLLLTHAHLDHCGRIPLLAKEGFDGAVISTRASRRLARIVLLDTAEINEEEAERRARHRRRRGEPPPEPLYTSLDALDAMDLFRHSVEYDTPIRITDHVTATFLDAGHILGSASILLEIEDEGRRRSIVFSGDIGSHGRPLLHDPTPPPADVDYLVMETTYGSRRHRPVDESVEELFDAIRKTFARGGNVLVPTFALERAQELLFHLRQGVDDGRLPAGIQVFLDSPMAISATQIFRKHCNICSPAVSGLIQKGEDPFYVPGMHFTRTPEASRRINDIKSGAVILAGSGMCAGGRILHHLKHNVWRPECSIVFVGFAAPGTLARRIIDGEEMIRIYGDEVAVKSEVYTINGFSAHADRDELLAWHAAAGRPRKTFLVHGDPDRGLWAMARTLEQRGFDVLVPEMHQRIALD